MNKWIFILTLAIFSNWTQAATVSGTVSDAVSQESLSGATILLAIRTGGWQGTLDTIGQATSSIDGGFNFDSLAIGQYSLFVSLEGFASVTQNFRIQTANQNATQDITLTAVENGTLEGTITDAGSEEAIAGVQVVLFQTFGGFPPTRVPVDTVTSGLDGSYSFGEVQSGIQFVLEASADGYDAATSQAFSVQANQTRTVDLALDVHTPPTGGIHGTVTDQNSNEALAGAIVILRTGSFSGGGMVWTEAAVDTTAADGGYSFEGLEPSSFEIQYSIQVTLENYIDHSSNNIQVVDTMVTRDVQLEHVQTGTLTVYVGRSQEVGGSAIGVRIRNVEVTAVLGRDNAVKYSGFTDTSGHVTFRQVLVGNYTITASKDAWFSNSANTRIDNNESDTTIILLDKVYYGTFHVFVGLSSEYNGRPVGDAIKQVMVTAALEIQGGPIFSGLTDLTGWVVFENAPIGNYTLTASKANWATETQGRLLTENENDTAFFLLDRDDSNAGNVISGTVIDENNQPVEGASVSIQAVQGSTVLSLVAMTDSSGIFVIARIPVSYDNAEILITAPGYFDYSETVQISVDTTTVSAIMVDDPTGIQPLQSISGPVFFSANGTINVSGIQHPSSLSAFDLMGKEIGNWQVEPGSQSFKPGGVAKGSVLFLRLRTGTSLMMKKIVLK